MPSSNINTSCSLFGTYICSCCIRAVSNVNNDVQGEEFQATFFYCDFLVVCLRILDNFTGRKYRNFQSELKRVINIRIKTGNVIFNVSRLIKTSL
jgi:hypothetical protein